MALRGPMQWASSNPRAIAVDDEGVVRALRPGFADILVRAGDLQDSCRVTVHSKPAPALRFIDPPSSLTIGDQVELRAEVFTRAGKQLADREIKWRSAAPKVASITPEGLLSARAPGYAIISASSEGRSRTLQIEVRPLPIVSLAVEPRTLNLRAGRREQLRVRALDATNRAVDGHHATWTVDDPRVVMVDDSGTVTAEAPGQSVVHVMCDGKVVSVPVVVAADPFAAFRGRGAQRVGAGVAVGAIAMVASVFLLRQPAGAPNSVAQVAPTTSDTAPSAQPVPETTATATVVPSPPSPRTGVESASAQAQTPTAAASDRVSLALRPRSVSLEVGGTDTVAVSQIVSGTPQPTTVPVSWRVADTTVATLTGDGIITGRTPGSTRLVAQVDGATATAQVRVTAVAIDSMAITPGAVRVKARDSVRLDARAFDRRGQSVSQPAVEWSSSRPDVATVDDRGNVAALAAGITEVTVVGGNKRAVATVTVEEVSDTTPTGDAPGPLTTERIATLLDPLVSALNRSDTDAVNRLYREGIDAVQRRAFFDFLARSRPQNARVLDIDGPTSGEGDRRELPFRLRFDVRLGGAAPRDHDVASRARFSWNGTEWVFQDFWMLSPR
jgi:trimeric autotransporter adhesin